MPPRGRPRRPPREAPAGEVVRRYPLRYQFVKDETNDLYLRAIDKYVQWCYNLRLEPWKRGCLDTQVSSYIEHLYEDGLVLKQAALLLSGLQHFGCITAKSLMGSWRTFGAWKKQKAPGGALPMPPGLVVAIAVYFSALNEQAMAASILMAFHCMLRTGEILQLTCSRLSFQGNRAVFSIPDTKSSAAGEAVTVEDPVVIKVLRRAYDDLRSKQMNKFISLDDFQFRAVFKGAMLHLFGSDCGFTPYSFRKGGATYDYDTHGSLDRTMFRGRWKHLKTAKVYILSAKALSVEIHLEADVREKIQAMNSLASIMWN